MGGELLFENEERANLSSKFVQKNLFKSQPLATLRFDEFYLIAIPNLTATSETDCTRLYD